MFVDRGRCRGLCSWRRPDRAGLQRLAPENAYRINAFLRANPDHPEPDFKFFLGTHCLLRHHTQWIAPLHHGLYQMSFPILIQLSTLFRVSFHVKAIWRLDQTFTI